MSEQAAEAPEEIELPPSGDAAFGALMDALAPEEAGEEAAADGAAAPAAADGSADTDGGGDAEAERPAAADAEAGEETAPAAGSDPAAAGAAGDAAGGAGDAAARPDATAVPATWTASATEYAPKLGELSNQFEERVTAVYQQQAMEELREEHANYFDALEKHPRQLVGQQVPSVTEEGLETLRDSADAKEWQEAVRDVLVQEVRERTSKQLEDNKDFLATIHSSIELFQNNKDLIPGTKDFDVDLANRFAEFAQPYELRNEGKLQGYSIPVQPLIERIRTQLAAERKAQPAQPTKQPPAGKATSTPSTPPEAPQAGIPSKAGNSSNKEDFSTLFGTIGLPNLQI